MTVLNNPTRHATTITVY